MKKEPHMRLFFHACEVLSWGREEGADRKEDRASYFAKAVQMETLVFICTAFCVVSLVEFY